MNSLFRYIFLLDVIDRTLSPMGGRLLKRWLALPLKDATKIQSRHQVVAYLKENQEILKSIYRKFICKMFI